MGTRIKCGGKSKFKFVLCNLECSVNNVGFSNETLWFEQVKAVYYNDTPISKAPVYLFVGERWSECLLKNLTTDSNGVAEFSFSTDNFHEDIKLHVSR